MRRGHGRRWGGYAAVVALLALTSCGGGDTDSEPQPSPSASASPTESGPAASTAPTIASPTLPAEAQTADVAGAEAFIRYYIDTVNYAYTTGDLGPMKAITAIDCSACIRVEGIIQDGYSNGSHIAGAELHVDEVTVTPGDPSIGLDAAATVDQAAGEVISTDGSVLEQLPEGEQGLITFLIIFDDAWSVSQWART